MKLLSNLNTGVFKIRSENLVHHDIDKAVPPEDIPNLEEMTRRFNIQLKMIHSYWLQFKKIDDEQNKIVNAGGNVDPEQIKKMNMIEECAYKIFSKLPASLKKLSFTRVFKFN